MTLRDQNATIEARLSPSSQRIAELLREAKTRGAGVSKPVLETGAGTRFVEDKITALVRYGFVIGEDIEDDERVYVLVHDPGVGRRADIAEALAPSASDSVVGSVSASSNTGESERLFKLPAAHFDLDLAA